MVAAIGFHGTDQQFLVPALYRFTGGRLGSVRLVVDAIAVAPPGPVSLPDLLARRPGADRRWRRSCSASSCPGSARTPSRISSPAPRASSRPGLAAGPARRAAGRPAERRIGAVRAGAVGNAGRRRARGAAAGAAPAPAAPPGRPAGPAARTGPPCTPGSGMTVPKRTTRQASSTTRWPWARWCRWPGGWPARARRRRGELAAAAALGQRRAEQADRRQSRSGLGQPAAAADRIRELTAGTDPRDVSLAPLAPLLVFLWIAADPLFASHHKELGRPLRRDPGRLRPHRAVLRQQPPPCSPSRPRGTAALGAGVAGNDKAESVRAGAGQTSHGRWWLLAAGGVAELSAVSLVLALEEHAAPGHPVHDMRDPQQRAAGKHHRRLVHLRPRTSHGRG